MSLTGYCFMITHYAINRKETLQSTVALSTTKAEYVTFAEAVKEAIWLRGLIGDLDLHQTNTVYYDNQSAVHLSKHSMYHTRTNDIHVRYYFIRDLEVFKVEDRHRRQSNWYDDQAHSFTQVHRLLGLAQHFPKHRLRLVWALVTADSFLTTDDVWVNISINVKGGDLLARNANKVQHKTCFISKLTDTISHHVKVYQVEPEIILCG